MTDVDATKVLEDFIGTGRTGRRNALADILDTNHGKTSTAGLPAAMDKLQCSDGGSEEGKSDSACGSAPTDKKDTAKDTDSKDS